MADSPSTAAGVPPDPVPAAIATSETGAAPAPGDEPLRGRIEELARKENERAEQHRQNKADFAQRGQRLLQDVPPRFFALCAALRQAVGRFNAVLDGGEFTVPLRYEEAPGVTLRDASADDLRVTVARRGARFELILRYMNRAGKPPVPIIEGYGAYGQNLDERVLLRIEGWVAGGQTTYWVRVDFRKIEIDLAELPERIVMSVLQIDPTMLWKNMREEPPKPEEEAEA